MSRSSRQDVTDLRNIKALIRENEEALDLIIPNLALWMNYMRSHLNYIQVLWIQNFPYSTISISCMELPQKHTTSLYFRTMYTDIIDIFIQILAHHPNKHIKMSKLESAKNVNIISEDSRFELEMSYSKWWVINSLSVNCETIFQYSEAHEYCTGLPD